MDVKFLVLTSVLISTSAGLQLEVNRLSKSLENIRASDAKAASALSKFEHDLFGRMKAEENARQAALAAQDAARRRDIDKGLNGLPTHNFRGPIYWNEQ